MDHSKVISFPRSTITLSFCDTTGEGTIDYRHVQTREQLAAMLGCFMSDLIAESYLSAEEIRAVMITAIDEGKGGNSH